MAGRAVHVISKSPRHIKKKKRKAQTLCACRVRIVAMVWEEFDSKLKDVVEYCRNDVVGEHVLSDVHRKPEQDTTKEDSICRVHCRIRQGGEDA